MSRTEDLSGKSKRKITRNEFRYAFGMFGTSIPINMFKTYAAIFYVDRLGLITTKDFSLILFIYTFLDAIDNPVYGFLSDRTRTPWGRRRPWIIIGAPLLVLCFILFFNPPASLAAGSAFSYILIMYMLTGTLDSLINASYGALFPELFRTEEERASCNAMRQIFQYLAMVISIALTPVITEHIGFRLTSYIYGALAIIVIWFMGFGVHEDPTAMEVERPKLLGTILDVFRNPKFWIYGITNAAYYAGLSLVQSGVPFYVKYHLHFDSLGSTILLGIFMLATVVLIPVWVRIVNKLTLMPAWRLAFLCCLLGVIPLYFAGNLAAAAICVIPFGFALAGGSVTMDLVGARIMDEDREKTHLRREGSYSSLFGILNKASGFFTSLAYLLLFHLYGFENGDNPGNNPDGASRFLMVLCPLGVFLICVIMSRFMKFHKEET